MNDPVERIAPGTTIRLRVPKPCFYPEGHPLRTTRHGPLIPRGAKLRCVGPDPERPGVHVALTPPQVFFGLDELADE